jgi:hypothetical protein
MDAPRSLPLVGIPEDEPNIATPTVVAYEDHVCLIYEAKGSGWPHSDDMWAVVHFEGCLNHLSGYPNDEAWHNHPLAKIGKRTPCEIVSSPWALERSRIAHRDGDPNAFLAQLRHFIFPLKEGTFECLARKYTVIGTFPSLAAAMQRAFEASVDES